MKHRIITRSLAAIVLCGIAPLPFTSQAFGKEVALSDVAATPAAETTDPWGLDESDIPIDPEWKLGQLNNGMRYIVRSNKTPEGQAVVRLHIGSGWFEEQEGEKGLAHFIEHMAFNGSNKVPEGEMVKLLERKGLAFGADTNAHTTFDETVYKLDLPKNSEDLLDTALMLMRETASELTISQEAVDRERGVILSETRSRNNFGLKNAGDGANFFYKGSRLAEVFPSGDPGAVPTAKPEDLRRYYVREYVPGNATLVVVGDYPVGVLEQKIKARFADWQAAPLPTHPGAGPINLEAVGQSEIYVDPALPESVQIGQNAAWKDTPDTAAERRRNTIAGIGYGIINRRLQALSRGENPAFVDARFGSSDLFKAGRSTSLTVVTEDGKWKQGLDAVVPVWRAAMQYGFTKAEVAEQIANRRKALEDAAASETTRGNAPLTSEALSFASDQIVPSTPSSSLERFNSFAGDITPELVLAALKDDAAQLGNPLIRFSGKAEPKGGKQALRDGWNSAQKIAIAPPEEKAAIQFGYTNFGPPGKVVSDTVDPRLDIREIRFANGVRLNLKKTDLKKDEISFNVDIDGGDLLNTQQQPRITALVQMLPAGGLGKHSADELATILAGRSVSTQIGSDGETFQAGGATTPDDLELQLQLVAAMLSDPGYRKSAETKFYSYVPIFFAQADATPGGAASMRGETIISDGDPRFSFGDKEDYLALTFDAMKPVVGERFKNGAIEVGLVGDLDEAKAIKLVANTLGALPKRESNFQARPEARKRSFTEKRGKHVITHKGNPQESVLRLVWPTSDYRDLKLDREMEMLARVVDIRLTDELRERLGETYSPYAGSSMSSTYDGYGTFMAGAQLATDKFDQGRQAMIAVIEELRAKPVDADVLERARKPLLERYDNALKTNGGWLGRVSNAQRKPDWINRFLASPDIIKAVTPGDLQKLAVEYLDPAQAVELWVVPADDAKTAPGD